MKKSFPFSAVLSFLSLVWLAQVSSLVQAQAAPVKDCSEARDNFVSTMETFRAAYFLREDATGTAESVIEGLVEPAAEQMYASCPENMAAAIRAGVERARHSLSDPRRWELVACDKALVNYQGLLRRYDSVNLGSYSDYRNLIHHDISPAASAAIEACPQMSELAQQTRLEINERQRRLDAMEDIDNQGPSIWETRDNMEEYLEAYEDRTN